MVTIVIHDGGCGTPRCPACTERVEIRSRVFRLTEHFGQDESSTRDRSADDFAKDYAYDDALCRAVMKLSPGEAVDLPEGRVLRRVERVK